MSNEAERLKASYIRSAKAALCRIRNIFWGSIALSVLLFGTFACLPRRPGSLSTFVNLSFPALLLWSFALAGYAFHCLLAQAKEREQLIEQYALLDPTTGAKSLEYMKSLLQEHSEGVSPTGTPTTVLYVDLENLRQVNRELGHTAGNIVLRDLAGRIRDATPENGVVGRVGGDEFVVLLPGMSSKSAQAVAEAIQRNIQQYRLDLGKGRKVDFIGCGIGIIECPAEGGAADDIINLAQRACYQTVEETRGATDGTA